MKRRTFLLYTIILFTTKGFTKPKDNDEYTILNSTLNHLFPNTKRYNGASKFDAFNYLLFVSKHPTFNKEDFDFIIKGTKKIYEFNSNFVTTNKDTKEKILRKFEQLDFGKSWLSTIMYYGIEAMLSDPIYKGNKNMLGWKNINHTPPVPMATQPFGKMS